MKPQEIFDTIALHLFTQGKRATDFNQSYNWKVCRYRTSDGLKCAAGCLIPDDKYDPKMEGWAINGEKVRTYLPQFVIDNIWLVVDLQKAHDSAGDETFIRDVSDSLKNIAIKHNLSSKVLKELEANNG